MNEIIVGSSADPVKQGLDKISANVKWRQNFYEQVHLSLGPLRLKKYFPTRYLLLRFITSNTIFIEPGIGIVNNSNKNNIRHDFIWVPAVN